MNITPILLCAADSHEMWKFDNQLINKIMHSYDSKLIMNNGVNLLVSFTTPRVSYNAKHSLIIVIGFWKTYHLDTKK